jgi:signal transduction histidine kinase
MSVREEMYKERIREMEECISNLERVLKLVRVINATLESTELLDIIVQVVTELLQTESASIMLIDKETGELHFKAVAGENRASIRPIAVPMEGSIAGQIATQNQPLLIRDVKSDPRWYRQADEKSGFVTRSIIGVPMQVQGKVIGVVEAVNKRGDAEMTWEDVRLLTVLADQAAIAIQNAELLAELKSAYEELNQFDQMKSEFIAVAAHELRTPLSLILGYAMFLRAEASGETQEQLNIVLQSAMRLRSLIEDMVNLREVESGEVALELETFSVQEMVFGTVEDLSPIAEAKRQRICLSMPREPIVVEADRNKMTLVVSNLLSNAIKFTQEGNSVGVQAGSKGSTAWFTVWDTGIGIPKKELGHIFDRFYQIEPSLSRHYEGMGLGLSIAKAMVDLHHGRIKVQSREGKGSAFTVSVPLRYPVSPPKKSKAGKSR